MQAPSGNLEQRAFDFLAARAGVDLREACSVLPQRCESVRQAFYRLREQGLADCVKAGGVRLFFVVRNAARPLDDRGAWRKK